MLTVIINILVENEVRTRYILMIINDISTDTTLRLFNVKTRCYKEECNILPHEALRTYTPIKGAKIKMPSPLRALLSNVVQIWNVY